MKRLNRCIQCGKILDRPVINLPIDYMKTAEYEYVCSKKCSEDFDWEVLTTASGG